MSRPALLLAALLWPASLSAAPNYIRFTAPAVSKDSTCTRTTDPAAWKRTLVYVLNATPGRWNYNTFILLSRIELAAAGSKDGAAYRLYIPTVLYLPGDSLVARVAVVDSAGNWSGANCGGDAEHGFRAK